MSHAEVGPVQIPESLCDQAKSAAAVMPPKIMAIPWDLMMCILCTSAGACTTRS